MSEEVVPRLDFVGQLPLDITEKLFSQYLCERNSEDELNRLRLVSKTWQEIIDASGVWTLFARRRGMSCTLDGEKSHRSRYYQLLRRSICFRQELEEERYFLEYSWLHEGKSARREENGPNIVQYADGIIAAGIANTGKYIYIVNAENGDLENKFDPELPEDHALTSFKLKEGMLAVHSCRTRDNGFKPDKHSQRFAVFDVEDNWSMKCEIWGNISLHYGPQEAFDFSPKHDIIAVMNELVQPQNKKSYLAIQFNVHRISDGKTVFTSDGSISGPDVEDWDYDSEDSDGSASNSGSEYKGIHHEFANKLTLAFSSSESDKSFFLVWGTMDKQVVVKVNLPQFEYIASESFFFEENFVNPDLVMNQNEKHFMVKNGMIHVIRTYIDTEYIEFFQDEDNRMEVHGLLYQLNFSTSVRERSCFKGKPTIIKYTSFIASTDNIYTAEILDFGEKYILVRFDNVFLDDETDAEDGAAGGEASVVDKDTHKLFSLNSVPPDTEHITVAQVKELNSFTLPICFSYFSSAEVTGNSSWMDGFDGTNDKGIVLVRLPDMGNCLSFQVLRWAK